MLKNLLSDYLPNELINEILKYDAHTQCMNEIKNFNKNPKKNSTRLRRLKMLIINLDKKNEFNKNTYEIDKDIEIGYDILCKMYDDMNFNQIDYLNKYVFC